MYGKIKVEGEPDAQAVAQFFRKAADDITTRVLKPGVSYYQPESRLRSIILHFSPGAPPDLKTAWPEVQRLLAMDPHDDPYLAAKYTPDSTVNQGEEGRGQFMAFSPYASLLIVPGVDKKWRRRRLRNHIGGIAELAAIQGSFLRQLRLAFELRYRELSHKPGYPRKEIIAFIRGFRDKLGDKVASVEDVLGLQSGLELEEKREWFRWYVSMANASGLGDELRQFKESLENLDKLNKEVGGAARKDLSSLYDKVTSLDSLLSSHG